MFDKDSVSEDMELAKNYHKLGEQADSVFQVSFRVKPEKDSLQSSKIVYVKFLPLGVKTNMLEQLQNTRPLIYMSLNKNSVYCVMPRSSKPPDTDK